MSSKVNPVPETPKNAEQKLQKFGRDPVRMKCHNCGQIIITDIQRENGMFACLLCFAMCIFLPPFCCAPLFCEWPKDIVHYCPQCDVFLGVDKKV